MSNALLIHATGLAALALNVVALTCTCERSLRLRSGVSGIIWALNNFLLGANVAASLMSTYAVFHLTGRSLRWVMLAVSALWMFNAWSVGSWEQVAANAISAAASLYGACRVARPTAS